MSHGPREIAKAIRRRLRQSPYNLCPACIKTIFAPKVRARHPDWSRQQVYLRAIEVMEYRLSKGNPQAIAEYARQPPQRLAHSADRGTLAWKRRDAAAVCIADGAKVRRVLPSRRSLGTRIRIGT